LFLMQRLRDEAHRFAISYHRSKRAKAMTSSVLDDISGLGESKRTALLRHFGSVKKVRAATVEELCEVQGIGPALADKVAAALAD
ncbi:helix-hairpin-helix domain-containing protein, partial [Brevibacterium sp.]|uniref:helix-hairpin-helix domain-containing protein n=1 Tax=Brevibacterium sp. TaxID=1701 RepID=UPI002649D311